MDVFQMREGLKAALPLLVGIVLTTGLFTPTDADAKWLAMKSEHGDTVHTMSVGAKRQEVLRIDVFKPDEDAVTRLNALSHSVRVDRRINNRSITPPKGWGKDNRHFKPLELLPHVFIELAGQRMSAYKLTNAVRERNPSVENVNAAVGKVLQMAKYGALPELNGSWRSRFHKALNIPEYGGLTATQSAEGLMICLLALREKSESPDLKVKHSGILWDAISSSEWVRLLGNDPMSFNIRQNIVGIFEPTDSAQDAQGPLLSPPADPNMALMDLLKTPLNRYEHQFSGVQLDSPSACIGLRDCLVNRNLPYLKRYPGSGTLFKDVVIDAFKRIPADGSFSRELVMEALFASLRAKLAAQETDMYLSNNYLFEDAITNAYKTDGSSSQELIEKSLLAAIQAKPARYEPAAAVYKSPVIIRERADNTRWALPPQDSIQIMIDDLIEIADDEGWGLYDASGFFDELGERQPEHLRALHRYVQEHHDQFQPDFMDVWMEAWIEEMEESCVWTGRMTLHDKTHTLIEERRRRWRNRLRIP